MLLPLSMAKVELRLFSYDLPPAGVVRSQAKRWFEAHCFENAVHDLRLFNLVQQQRGGEPCTIIIDSRTLESGHRAGFDGAKKRKGTQVHVVVDTLSHLLIFTTSPANEQDRSQVEAPCHSAQEITDGMIEVAIPDQRYTDAQTLEGTYKSNVELVVVKHRDASRGFVLLPKR